MHLYLSSENIIRIKMAAFTELGGLLVMAFCILVLQHAEQATGLACFQCSAVANLNDCNTTVQCQADEQREYKYLINKDITAVYKAIHTLESLSFHFCCSGQIMCYAKRKSNDTDDVYTLDCESRTVCEIIDSGWSAPTGQVVENVTSSLGTAVRNVSPCNKCCDSDNCNLQLCRKGSQWLNKTCASNGDCPAPRSACFDDRCLCTPGFYYSHSQDLCSATCSEGDLRNEFLMYPHTAMSVHGSFWYYMQSVFLESVSGISQEECKERCSANPRCRMINYEIQLPYCYLQKTNSTEYISWMTNLNFTFYQRSCI